MKKLLPFGILPGHWGLRGITRELAKAEYELEGYEKDVKIAHIKYHDDKVRLDEEIYKIDRQYGHITEEQFETAMTKLKLTGLERDIALLDLEKKYKGIPESEYKMRLATLKNEPYITVVNCEYDSENDVNGFTFEFDWNQQWIDLLKKNGYDGFTDEQLVQKWFEDVCRGVVLEGLEANGVPFGI